MDLAMSSSQQPPICSMQASQSIQEEQWDKSDKQASVHNLKQITKWSLRSVFPVQKQVTVIIEGLLLPDEIVWKSSPIEKIVNGRVIYTTSQSIYELVGVMNVEQTIRNGFSSIFAEYIKNGFPDNWQFVLRSRIESGLTEETQLLKRKIQEIQKFKENKSLQESKEKPNPLPVVALKSQQPVALSDCNVNCTTVPKPKKAKAKSSLNITKLAGKGTLKRREQLRELYEEYDDTIANKIQLWSDGLFSESPSNFDRNQFSNIQMPSIGTRQRKNSLDLSLSLSMDDDITFEPFQIKELDRVIVDEKRIVRKGSRKKIPPKLPVARAKSICITQEDGRSRVRASIAPNGETRVEIVDKNDSILCFSEEESSDEIE